MFINKNEYYIYIENLSSINLNLIKKRGKFNLILRNNQKKQKLSDLIEFKRMCKKNNIKFYISNDVSLALKIGVNGVYLSSYNKAIVQKANDIGKRLEIIGSAHNFREIDSKKRQGCKKIFLSRLFKTDYKNKKTYLGTTKFNLLIKNFKNYFVALGGIRSKNLMRVKLLNCDAVALLSEVKKKPAIIHRLF